jgi:O-antigen/teichoic acid export membrane protein
VADFMRGLIKKRFVCFVGDETGSIVGRGTATAFVVKMTGAGLVFISNVLLARMLGAEEYGFYVYVLSWMFVLVLAGKFGLESASIRYVAAYSANMEWGLLRGYLLWSSRIATVSSITVAVLSFTIVLLIGGRDQERMLLLFAISFLLLPFTVILIIRSAALQGLKKVAMAQGPISVLLPMLLVTGVFAIWVATDGNVGAVSAMSVYLCATVISLGLVFYFMYISFPQEAMYVDTKYRTREWINTAFFLLAISGFFVVIEHTDIIIVGLFHGTTNSGVYAAAKKVASLIASGLIIVNVIVAPMISHLYVIGNNVELKRVVRMAAIFSFAISLPAAAIIFFFGNWIMTLFGYQFSEGYTALIILTIGQLVNALAGSVGFFMTMTGNEKAMAWIAGSCAVLNVALNFILIPPFGMEGAAVSTAFSVAIWNVGLVVYIFRKFRIHVSILSLSDVIRRNHAV